MRLRYEALGRRPGMGFRVCQFRVRHVARVQFGELVNQPIQRTVIRIEAGI